MKFERNDILNQLRENIESGQPIIGGGAGTGLSAKCEEAGGIDLIVIYPQHSVIYLSTLLVVGDRIN